ncbi:MAG TPA: efflux RND transporter periplasmic adaptor subunit [Marinilabiliaceae bacterium]|nr:efflux RND transporter periplasmic adaptor subunit [Marinilabiliaceae bacterium]
MNVVFKKKFLAIAIAAVALIVVLLSLLNNEPDTAIRVNVVLPQIRTIINSVSATGTVEPTEQVEVGTQVSGVIDKLYVDYNTSVKRGQLLAELDKSTLRARVLQAKASLSSAQNELNYQTLNFNRIKALFESEMVSEIEYESADYKLNNASASVERLISELDQAEVNLSYATIYSPIDGIVLERTVEQGQTVAASFNTPTLFTIAKDLKSMQVEADVDEADIGQVEVGQKVSFTVDAYPEDVFVGKITQLRLMPIISSNVVTYTVIVDAPNPELKLKPGLTATITIITKEIKDALSVPASAINKSLDENALLGYQLEGNRIEVLDSDAHQSYVWVKKGEMLKQKTVLTGITDRAYVQVLSGLEENDSVVLSITEKQMVQSQEGLNSPFMPGRPARGK